MYPCEITIISHVRKFIVLLILTVYNIHAIVRTHKNVP